MADPDSQGSDVLKTLSQVVGLVAGFIALVYAAGGGVLALRLYLAHLPSRAVVGQLPRDLLISVGLAQIVLPLLAVAALYATFRLLWGSARPPSMLVHQWKQSWRGGIVLVAASAIPALVAVGWVARGWSTLRGGWKGLLWLLPVTFLLTQLVVLVALNLRARLADRYGDSESLWNTRRPIVRMTLVVALAFLPACAVFAGTHPLPNAKICTASGTEVKGVLIGETSDRTYIGEERPPHIRPNKPLLVFSIPQPQITETLIGGPATSNQASAACPALGPAPG